MASNLTCYALALMTEAGSRERRKQKKSKRRSTAADTSPGHLRPVWEWSQAGTVRSRQTAVAFFSLLAPAMKILRDSDVRRMSQRRSPFSCVCGRRMSRITAPLLTHDDLDRCHQPSNSLSHPLLCSVCPPRSHTAIPRCQHLHLNDAMAGALLPEPQMEAHLYLERKERCSLNEV